MNKQFIEENSIPIPESGCWVWVGTCSKSGYGIIKINNKLRPAHRISYELYRGIIPEKMFVCHHCDIPSCINPNHLFIGTQKDNISDCIKKNRFISAMSLKTHCKRGHEFNEENTYRYRNRRRCQICWREYHKIYMRTWKN